MKFFLIQYFHFIHLSPGSQGPTAVSSGSNQTAAFSLRLFFLEWRRGKLGQVFITVRDVSNVLRLITKIWKFLVIKSHSCRRQRRNSCRCASFHLYICMFGCTCLKQIDGSGAGDENRMPALLLACFHYCQLYYIVDGVSLDQNKPAKSCRERKRAERRGKQMLCFLHNGSCPSLIIILFVSILLTDPTTRVEKNTDCFSDLQERLSTRPA